MPGLGNNLQNLAKYISLSGKAEWRNGRRWGLKIPCPNGRVGSTPTSANVFTTQINVSFFRDRLTLALR